jgi:hypothetical protein
MNGRATVAELRGWDVITAGAGLIEDCKEVDRPRRMRFVFLTLPLVREWEKHFTLITKPSDATYLT